MLSSSATNCSIENNPAPNFQAHYDHNGTQDTTIGKALQILENQAAGSRKPREKLPEFTKRRKGLIEDIKVALFSDPQQTNIKFNEKEKNLIKIIAAITDLDKLKNIISDLASLKNHQIIATRVDGSGLPSRTKIIFKELEIAARARKHQVEYTLGELSISNNTVHLYKNKDTNYREINIRQALEELNTLASAYKNNEPGASYYPSARAALISDILNALTNCHTSQSHCSEEYVKSYIAGRSLDTARIAAINDVSYQTEGTLTSPADEPLLSSDVYHLLEFDETPPATPSKTGSTQLSQNQAIKELNTIITDLSKLKAQPFAQRLDGKNGTSETIKIFERIVHAAALKRLQLSLEFSYPDTFNQCFTNSGLSYSSLRQTLEDNSFLHQEHNRLDNLINHFYDYLIVISDLSIIESNVGFFGTPETRQVRGLVDNLSADNAAQQQIRK